MPLEQTEFSISRLSDRAVVEAVKGALANDFRLTKCSLATVFGGNALDGLPGQSPETDKVLAEDSIAVLTFDFVMNNGSTVSVRREHAQGRRLTGYHDNVTVKPAPNDEDHAKYARLVKRLRKDLRAVDGKAFLDFLKEEDRAFYEAREQSLQKLQAMQEDFFREIREFTTHQAELYLLFRTSGFHFLRFCLAGATQRP